MFRSLAARAAVILGIVAVCAWNLYGNQREIGSPVRLGLDLQGGIHLLLEVDDPAGTMSAEARADAVERASRVIRTRVDALGVAEPIVQVVGGDRLIVELAGIDDEERAREMIGRTAMLEWRLVRPTTVLENALPRLDAAAARSPSSARSSSSAETLSSAETPASAGISSSAETPFSPQTPFSSMLLGGGGAGELWVAPEHVERVRGLLADPEFRAALPRGVSLHWGLPGSGSAPARGTGHRVLYVLDAQPFLTGEMLEDARSGRDPEFNRPLVHFDLSRAGGLRFGEMTGRHVGDRIAILLDEEVVSAPVVRSRIGASGVIEMDHATMEEARDLALLLRAGALPAPLRIMEERAVGPSLGRDSIEAGARAGLVGLVAVALIMVAYYRTAGLIAVAALGVYVILLLGGLSLIDRVLTLPGIAGIILSIGMAVDANVLIFERIREELAEGRKAGAAVDAGFAQALSAIVDANVTTLVTALVLYQIGTGPVRGFAVTLSIGIVASFFTAVYVTRTLFMFHLRLRSRREVGGLGI